MAKWIYHIYDYFSTSTYRTAKRVVRVVVGFTLLLIGIALIFLPGPASVVIPIALVILAGEFVWARWLLKKFNEGYNSGMNGLGRLRKYFKQ
jgi:hypothetical protein